MISEAIDFRFLLLESYKKLKLNENELAVIFMIDHLIGQGNPFVTADLLSLKMTLEVKEIDKILAALLTRGFIEYVSQGKKTVTTLNPLKEKLYREFQMTSSFEEAYKNSKKVNDMINNVYAEFERLLNRPLSQVEFSRIREWISYGYSDETIINALKGHSPMNETWDKNLEETIRIAKTPWLDQYEDDEDKK